MFSFLRDAFLNLRHGQAVDRAWFPQFVAQVRLAADEANVSQVLAQRGAWIAAMAEVWPTMSPAKRRAAHGRAVAALLEAALDAVYAFEGIALVDGDDEEAKKDAFANVRTWHKGVLFRLFGTGRAWPDQQECLAVADGFAGLLGKLTPHATRREAHAAVQLILGLGRAEVLPFKALFVLMATAQAVAHFHRNGTAPTPHDYAVFQKHTIETLGAALQGLCISGPWAPFTAVETPVPFCPPDAAPHDWVASLATKAEATLEALGHPPTGQVEPLCTAWALLTPAQQWRVKRGFLTGHALPQLDSAFNLAQEGWARLPLLPEGHLERGALVLPAQVDAAIGVADGRLPAHFTADTRRAARDTVAGLLLAGQEPVDFFPAWLALSRALWANKKWGDALLTPTAQAQQSAELNTQSALLARGALLALRALVLAELPPHLAPPDLDMPQDNLAPKDLAPLGTSAA